MSEDGVERRTLPGRSCTNCGSETWEPHDSREDWLECSGCHDRWIPDPDDADPVGSDDQLRTDGGQPADGVERIKFADELIAPVLNERKQATVRYDGYADVEVGDTLLATTADGSPFAEINVRRTAAVLAVEVHDVLEVLGADYPSETPQHVIDALNEHYDGAVGPGTTVQVLVFEVVRHV